MPKIGVRSIVRDDAVFSNCFGHGMLFVLTKYLDNAWLVLGVGFG